jgi:hypothetical protein
MSELLPIHARSRRISADVRVLELSWDGKAGRETSDISEPKWIERFLRAASVGGEHTLTGGVRFTHLPDLEGHLLQFFSADAEPLILLSALNSPAELDAAMADLRDAIAVGAGAGT